jgi:hypothetical protein
VVGSVKWFQGPLIEEAMIGFFGRLEEMRLAMLVPLLGMAIALLLDGAMGLVVGLAQWLVLKRHVERAGRWVLISAVAWGTGAIAMGLLGWAIDRPGQEVMHRVVPIIGGIVPGALLATGLIRLMPPGRSEPNLPE